jgi:hypothetical protein
MLSFIWFPCAEPRVPDQPVFPKYIFRLLAVPKIFSGLRSAECFIQISSYCPLINSSVWSAFLTLVCCPVIAVLKTQEISSKGHDYLEFELITVLTAAFR